MQEKPFRRFDLCTYFAADYDIQRTIIPQKYEEKRIRDEDDVTVPKTVLLILNIEQDRSRLQVLTLGQIINVRAWQIRHYKFDSDVCRETRESHLQDLLFDWAKYGDGNPTILQTLLDAGASLSWKGNQQTPLMAATEILCATENEQRRLQLVDTMAALIVAGDNPWLYCVNREGHRVWWSLNIHVYVDVPAFCYLQGCDKRHHHVNSDSGIHARAFRKIMAELDGDDRHYRYRMSTGKAMERIARLLWLNDNFCGPCFFNHMYCLQPMVAFLKAHPELEIKNFEALLILANRGCFIPTSTLNRIRYLPDIIAVNALEMMNSWFHTLEDVLYDKIMIADLRHLVRSFLETPR